MQLLFYRFTASDNDLLAQLLEELKNQLSQHNQSLTALFSGHDEILLNTFDNSSLSTYIDFIQFEIKQSCNNVNNL